MGVYDERPWLPLYEAGQPHDLEIAHTSMLAAFADSVSRAPDQDLLRYFDASFTVAEVDEITDALAVGLAEAGIGAGDRIAVYLQNVPQFVFAMIAAWKVGGVMVSINPMNKERELRLLLTDSGATALVCLESLYADVAATVVPDTDVRVVITTSELEYLAAPDERLFAGVGRVRSPDTLDLAELVEAHRGQRPAPVQLGLDDLAVLTYTSGTTGLPKGALNTHRTLVFNSQAYLTWIGLGTDDVALGVAPLFHITGLIGHIGIALVAPLTLVLAYKFQPDLIRETVIREECTFTIGSITVFMALMNNPAAHAADFASMTKIYSGGAAISPSTLDQFEAKFGRYIHNAYGLTETTSPITFVPYGVKAPVDPTSGAISVGVPVYDTVIRILDEAGADVAVGEVGEVSATGPQVVPGYWNKSEETAAAFVDGVFRTGDVGFMDEAGWFYLVDRKKDMINAAGYKVWPREVEDVLYTHPAVREAAVVGIPDAYRGETVKAYVSLKAGATVEPQELIDFCKSQMAAYKYPRSIEVLDDLPKTVTGKMLRRELRDKARADAE